MSNEELIALLEEKSNEVAALNDVIAEHEKTAAELQSTVEEKDAVITELMVSIPKVSSSDADNVFTHKGKQYKVVFKSFIHNQKTITASEVVANPKIAEELLEKRSPAIKIVA
jgi:hypothetical protein